MDEVPTQYAADDDTVRGFGDWSAKVGVGYPRSVVCGVFGKMHARGISDAHSLTLEFYGANGGIFRYFPRQRETMPLVFRCLKPGETSFYLIARDQHLKTLAIRNGVIEVRENTFSTGQAGMGDHPDLGNVDAQAQIAPAPILEATDKPPMAECNQSPDRLSRANPASALSSSLDHDVAAVLQKRLEAKLMRRPEDF